MSDDPTADAARRSSRRHRTTTRRRRRHVRRDAASGRRRRRRDWRGAGRRSPSLLLAVRARRRAGSVYQLTRPATRARRSRSTIQQGWGAQQIGDPLATQGVIGSSLAFQLYVEGHRRPARSRPARTAAQGPRRAEPRSTRSSGPADAQHYRKLALPPGPDARQIADRVGADPGLEPRRRSSRSRARTRSARSTSPRAPTSLEGLTWPDTYFVERGRDRGDILRDDRRRVRPAGDARRAARAAADPYRTVIDRVADPDRGQARRGPAAHRRRSSRTGCATTCRCRSTRRCSTRTGGVGTGAQRRRLAERLAVQHLQGTRACRRRRSRRSPSASLSAALHPANVPYMFYVLPTRTASTRSRRRYAEHQRNVARRTASRRAMSQSDHRGDAARGGHRRPGARTRAHRRSTTPRSRPPGSTGCSSRFQVPPGDGCDAVRAMPRPRARRAERHDAAQGRRGAGAATS